MGWTDQLISASSDDLSALLCTIQRRGCKKDTAAVCTVKKYKQWLENPSSPKYIQYNILTLNNEYCDDGLFLFLMDRTVHVYTFVENNPRVGVALKLLDLVDDYSLMYHEDRQALIVKATLKEIGATHLYHFFRFNYYYCSLEDALQVTYDIPEDVILKPLDASRAVEMNNHHHNKSQQVFRLIQQSIADSPSVGAFDKTTGVLMGWCLNYYNDCIGGLVVKSKFQGKGLGKLCVRKLMHDRAKVHNLPSTCYILEGNIFSERIFTAAGFKKIMSIYYDFHEVQV